MNPKEHLLIIKSAQPSHAKSPAPPTPSLSLLERARMEHWMSVLYLINPDRFAIQFDHVHDFDGVVGILLPEELHEPVALVRLCDPILWHVHVHCKKHVLKHVANS